MQVLLRIRNVLATTGLSRAGLYQRISEGCFPKQVKLGSRSVGWIESEISEWIAGRIRLSRAVSQKSSLGHPPAHRTRSR